MKYKIIIIVISVLLGLPLVASAGSFTVSLIQGKTPAEAVEILANQIDNLLGRVETLESAQVETSQNITEVKVKQEQTSQTLSQAQLEIEKLRLENENLKIQAENIKAQAKANDDRQTCANLALKMPAAGRYDLWGPTPTISALYHRAQGLLNGAGDDFLNLNENRDALRVEIRRIYEEAKPVYEAYVAKCGE